MSDARDTVCNCTKAMTQYVRINLCHACGTRRHRASAILLCVGLLLGGTPGGQTAPLAHEQRLDFETAAVGRLPAGFTTALTGRGSPGAWHIVEDPVAPSGGKVLAQTSADKTSYRFPLCVYDPLSATDVTVSVRFKTIAGTVDQAAGLIVRFKDPDNYYIVRANALENNVRLYIVKRGRRKQFAGVDTKIPGGQWQRLTLEVTGTHFRVFLNDLLLFEADDPTFRDAGKVGLWTKADSVTYFDDLTIARSDAH
jgi:3-keto-disaccharide hydrolase